MGDAVDTQPTTSSEPTPAGEDSDDAADESESGDGPETIGGEETGLTLEIPDEWVELPLDPDMVSEGLATLDLPDEQAALMESSMRTLGELDGAVMAIDSGTIASGFATNLNAYCVPNDGSVGSTNLEAAIKVGLEAIGEDIEVESVDVDGFPAGRATYTLDLGAAQGFALFYMIVADDDLCSVTIGGADDSNLDTFEEIAATISVL